MAQNLISDADWADFRNVMKSASDDFAKKPMYWVRYVSDLNRWGEDIPPITHNIVIHCLINYNYMRTWPITFATEAGELDRQSMQILISKDYLKTNGYLNQFGYINFNADKDRFVIDGIFYKSFGDTPVSQAHDDDIWFTLILKREETPTGGVVQPILSPVDPGTPGNEEDEEDMASVKNEIPFGLINNSNHVYSTMYPFKPGTLEITVNGIEQNNPEDFITTGVNTFSLVEPPEPGDILMVDYIKT